MVDLSKRNALEVLEDHLALAQSRNIDEDLQRNYAKDCIVLTVRGRYHGHKGLRELGDLLLAEVGDAKYHYVMKLVEERFAFLEWTADDGNVAIHDGADSYVIEGGKIVMQTIHYTLQVRDPALMKPPLR